MRVPSADDIVPHRRKLTKVFANGSCVRETAQPPTYGRLTTTEQHKLRGLACSTITYDEFGDADYVTLSATVQGAVSWSRVVDRCRKPIRRRHIKAMRSRRTR